MTFRILLAIVVIAIAAAIVAALPPKRLSLSTDLAAALPRIVGAFHIHSSRSDGTGTPDEIAAAAARAGLQFIVLTDHGNGTREPDAPQYRHGVLCLDGVEISTDDGHYLAVGLPKAPYPLAGEGRDVVEDVERLGGFGVVAHPDSAKPELQWDDWTAPFDAVEWLNADSEWRDETKVRLAQALVTYPFRPAETLASLLNRPEKTLRRWDELLQRRPVVAIAGTDAHARIGWQDDATEPYRSPFFVRIPDYRASFGSFTIHVELDRPLTGNAPADGANLLAALKSGRLYTSIDGLATPAQFRFTAGSGRHRATQGEPLSLDGPVIVDLDSNAPAGAVIALIRDGRIVTTAEGHSLRQEFAPASSVLRAEIWLANRPDKPPLPWIISNPIYIARPPIAAMPRRASSESRAVDLGAARIEQQAGSSGTLQRRGESLTINYTLQSGDRADQFVALSVPAPAFLQRMDRLSFQAAADRPMRISVQLRRAGESEGQRWRRSIYLEPQPQHVTIFLDELTPIGHTVTAKADLPNISDVLFAVDTTNTDPGQSGAFSIEQLRLES